MSRDHIIPQFILRGFATNPNANKNNQTVMLYDRATELTEIKKIGDAFSINDFNSKETEKLLARQYESSISNIFQRITNNANKDEKSITLTNSEYKLLIRFFVVMWRRNNIQMDKAKQAGIQIEEVLKQLLGSHYQDALNPEYKNYSFEKVFEDNFGTISKSFYDSVIQGTTDDDPTVQKTIKHYIPHIVYNKSNVHFILHNTYSTLKYIVKKGDDVLESDYPMAILYPISNILCFATLYTEKEIDVSKDSFIIPIEKCENDDNIKNYFIDGYITETATTFVVDETNIEYVKQYLANR